MPIRLSPLDSDRFGVKSARADDVTLDELPQIEAFCEGEDVEFLILRCDTRQLKVVQALESQGFLLMDTMVHHIYDVSRMGRPEVAAPLSIRAYRTDDYEAVLTIAAQAFEGYQGHYHADTRIEQVVADEIYADWARREIDDSTVFVADDNGTVAGFVTARMLEGTFGHVILAGVAKEAQSQGIYAAFLKYCVNWLADQGAERIWFVTQVTNVPVQRVWARMGCVPHHSEYTLHKWFDR
ncbi:MAG: GNAT family N-acetyltransferase [Anaerolineae bacterium]|nr:GNAT family N-acetyltransferase [Anaerolineae bacterium]